MLPTKSIIHNATCSNNVPPSDSSFNQLIGDLSELREKDYGDENERPRSILPTRNAAPEQGKLINSLTVVVDLFDVQITLLNWNKRDA